MTPAEIAAKLTPSQVRALRDPNRCLLHEAFDLWNCDWALIRLHGDMFQRLALGRAVLAALDGETK